jgi:hypothetical protein
VDFGTALCFEGDLKNYQFQDRLNLAFTPAVQFCALEDPAFRSRPDLWHQLNLWLVFVHDVLLIYIIAYLIQKVK